MGHIAARAVAANNPDVVVITGDLTDDGDGYELVEGAFGGKSHTEHVFVTTLLTFVRDNRGMSHPVRRVARVSRRAGAT